MRFAAQVRLDASEGESSGRAQRVAQLEARVAEVEAAEARLRGEQASSSEQARAAALTPHIHPCASYSQMWVHWGTKLGGFAHAMTRRS